MKVVFCSSEVVPFAKTGGLADVCGALPIALEKLGVEVCVVMPFYKCIKESNFEIEKINDELFMTTIGENICVYLVANEYLYNRDGLYSGDDGEFGDNLDRFQYYCIKALEIIKQVGFKADVFHCHDWQAALIPVYLKEKLKCDPFYSDMKSLLTIHNLAFQGFFPKREFLKLGLSDELFSNKIFEFYDQINLMKAGIVYSDEVSTVSDKYSHEIQTKEFGCNLEGVLEESADKIVGILNGLDYEIWDPQTDNFIFKKYSKEDHVEGKKENKVEIQKYFKLDVKEDVPLFGFVGRLSHQKGVDLLLESLDEIMGMDVQIIIQGVGDDAYYSRLKKFASRNPEKFALHLDFDEDLAHKIYAASDLFLMPSHYEPCGLSQMISLKYGTIPVVSNIGGLADTVVSCDLDEGNGFKFLEYTRDSFIEIFKKACSSYANKGLFSRLIENSFNANFPWERSAEEYIKVYKCMLSA